MNRRVVLFLGLLFVIPLGLLSRRVTLPIFQKEVGDALWAMAVYLALGFLFPKWSSLKLALFSAWISFAVEFAQLYKAPWIMTIRSYKLGHLILGSGFHWTDLAAYLAGIAIIALVDHRARSTGR